MTITNHTTGDVFWRYNVRRECVQADALSKQQAYLNAQRGSSTPVEHIGTNKGR